MRISSDHKAGPYTITPATVDEQTLIKALLETLKHKDALQYHGRLNKQSEPLVLRFNAGGTRCRVPILADGKEIGSSSGFEGGTTFEVHASDDDSLAVLGDIRNMCFFGSGGLIFLQKSKEDGVVGMLCTGGFCASCGSTMIGMAVRKGAVCRECSENQCVHEYEKTAFLSPYFGGMVAADVCTHCERMSPESLEKLKTASRKQQIEEAAVLLQEQNVPLFMPFGSPLDSLHLSVGEMVLLRDHETIPNSFMPMVFDHPEAIDLFKTLSAYLRRDG